MRIDDLTRSKNLTTNLSRTQAEMYKYQMQISSGKKIINVADDPEAYSRLQGYKTAISQTKGYMENIELNKNYLNTYESLVSQASSIYKEFQSLVSKAANDATYADNRTTILNRVNNLLQDLVNLGNINLNGEYVFAGSAAQTKPFETSSPGSTITSVTYKGDDRSKVFNPASGEKTEINLSGAEIFSGPAGMNQDVFQEMLNFRNDLKENHLENVDAHIETASKIYNRLVDKQGEIGSAVQHMENLYDFMTNFEASLEEKATNIEGVDMAEAITALLSQENVYEASLQVAARMNKMSLLDYIQ